MVDDVCFGAGVLTEGLDFEKVKAFCLNAEKLGYELFNIEDHLMSQNLNPIGPHPLECWTTLAGLAAVTDKIRLGPTVTCYGYRRPTILAKMATNLDIISKGRLVFGIGAGWHEPEFKAFMGRFPSKRERLRGLEESIEICKSMFSNERTTYRGRIYDVDDVLNSPQPVQKPIPIMVGGSGEKVTLRIAAKHADISHIMSRGLIEDKRKFSILREHCKAVSRDYDDIVKGIGFGTFIGHSEDEARSKAIEWAKSGGVPPEFMEKYLRERTPAFGAPESFVEAFKSYIDEGITLFTCFFHDLDDMQLFAEDVIPRVL